VSAGDLTLGASPSRESREYHIHGVASAARVNAAQKALASLVLPPNLCAKGEQDLSMSAVPQNDKDTKSAAEESATPERRIQDRAESALTQTKQATANTVAASRDAWEKAAELQREVARSQVAQRIAGLADRTANLTKQATTSAATASKTGLAKAAKIGRETVLPELGRTGAKLKERARPERLARDYRDSLIWLHENVLDYSFERLFFVPTKGQVPLAGLTVRGPNKASGHDYRPSPYQVFKWALSAIDEAEMPRLSFVDYGAGKGRALLMASQHPFTAVGGIEFAEELHDNAMMNIAQFPRSRMKCRNVECALDDVVNITPIEGEAVHYFFNPFSEEIFAEVLRGIVTSYHAKPRRLYVITIDMEVGEIMHKTGVFREIPLAPAARLQARLLSPYSIAVYRSLA